MEIANVLIAIDGEKGHTVPRYNVTVSEVAVLRALHGEDAVFDIEVTGDIPRKHREERERLATEYPKAKKAIERLFPGAAAPLFNAFSELDLPDELYQATGRQTPAAPKAEKTKAKAKAEANEGTEKVSDTALFE